MYYKGNITRHEILYLGMFHEHVHARDAHIVHLQEAVINGIVAQLRTNVTDCYACTLQSATVSSFPFAIHN